MTKFASIRLAKLVVGAVLVLAAVGVLSLLFFVKSPQQLLLQAREIQGRNPDRALKLVDQCLLQTPDDTCAQLLRCQILTATRHPQEALASYRRMHSPAACSSDELGRLIKLAHGAGDDILAELAMSSLDKATRPSTSLLKTMIEVKYALNRTIDTLELSRQYAELVTDDPFPWLISASIYHELDDRTEAIQAYQKALLRHPNDQETVRCRYQLMTLLMDAGDLTEARKQCDLLLAAPRDRTNIIPLELQNAELLRREGKSQQALAIVARILDAVPDTVQAIQLRGVLHFDAKDYALAIQDLEEVVRQQPFNQSAHYKLGQAYLRQNRPAESNVHLQRSQELILLSSEILVTENRLRNSPDNRELILKLVDLYESRGNPGMAARWRTKISDGR
jgi:tetratricopeptide (TPR) repeat protein